MRFIFSFVFEGVVKFLVRVRAVRWGENLLGFSRAVKSRPRGSRTMLYYV